MWELYVFTAVYTKQHFNNAQTQVEDFAINPGISLSIQEESSRVHLPT